MASKAWTRHRDTDRRTWTGRDDGSRAKQNANGSAHHRRSPSPATAPSFTQSLPFAPRHHLLQLRSLMAAICTICRSSSQLPNRPAVSQAPFVPADAPFLVCFHMFSPKRVKPPLISYPRAVHSTAPRATMFRPPQVINNVQRCS